MFSKSRLLVNMIARSGGGTLDLSGDTIDILRVVSEIRRLGFDGFVYIYGTHVPAG